MGISKKEFVTGMFKKIDIVPPLGVEVFLMVFFCLVVLPTASHLYAQEIGYDENTEITIRGTVVGTHQSPFHGLLAVLVQTDACLYSVLTGPRWFVDRMGLHLRGGTGVEVVGSKFYDVHGSITLVSRSIRILEPGGRLFVLRDNSCKPVWMVSGCSESSCLRVAHPDQ